MRWLEGYRSSWRPYLGALGDLFWGFAPFPRECAPAAPGPSIPRVIHSVFGLWDDTPLSWRMRVVLGGWARRHPGNAWRIVLWDRSSAESFLERECPDEWPRYRGLPRNVQRSDLLRHLLLERLGGFYVDLDLQCLRSLEGLYSAPTRVGVIAAVETTLTEAAAREIGLRQAIRKGRAEHGERIANYFLGSVAGHPILREILELTRERSGLDVLCDYDVL